MNDSRQKNLTRTALILAVTIIFQSLRLFIPIPPFASIFIVGSLVNTCLLVSVETVNIWAAIFISCIAPIVAYFQGHLPIPIFVIPVAIGNCIIVGVYYMLYRKMKYQAIFMSALFKTVFLFASFYWIISLIKIPSKLAAALIFAMGWPQFVTGVIGGLIAVTISKRIKSY